MPPTDDRRPGIRPRPTLLRRLDGAARASFPVSSAALLLLVLAGPLGLPGQAQWQGAVVLGCVFFWSVFRPASMPPLAVFALGLLADLIGLSPPGVSVLVLLAVHGLAVRWRRWLARQGFVVVWLAFMGVAAGAAVLGWALACALQVRLLPPGAAVFGFALSAGLYPALAFLLTAAHRTAAAPEQA
jgi:rod shape-determining protein MreD